MEINANDINKLEENVRALAEQQILLSNEVTSINNDLPALRIERDRIIEEINVCKEIKLKLDVARNLELEKREELLNSKEVAINEKAALLLDHELSSKKEQEELDLRKNAILKEEENLNVVKESILNNNALLNKKLAEVSDKENELSSREKDLSVKEEGIKYELNRIKVLSDSLDLNIAKYKDDAYKLSCLASELDKMENDISVQQGVLDNLKLSLDDREASLVAREDAIKKSNVEFDAQVKTIAEANNRISLAWLKVNKAIQDKQLSIDIESLKK